MRHIPMRMAVSVALASVALVVAACGSDNNDSSSSSSSGSSSSQSKKIALLLPESKTTRYEAQDRPLFTAKLKALCPNCQLIYSNADQDASKQQTQAEAAITQGANAIVLDPGRRGLGRGDRDPGQAVEHPGGLLRPAGHRTPTSTTTSPTTTRRSASSRATSLLKALGTPNGKSIVMINGAPTDNNAKLFKSGAHSCSTSPA